MSTGPLNKYTLPNVSVILLTMNGMPAVERCLEMLSKQNYLSALEIIHIDSGSTDGTLSVAAKQGIFTYHINQSEFHNSETRNFAVSLAQHEIVVFLSQDSIPMSYDWLSNLIGPFADLEVGGTYGRQIPPENIGALRKYSLSKLYPNVRHVREKPGKARLTLESSRFSNANSAIRVDLCRKFRFHKHAQVAEDHGMCRDILEAGYRIVYEPRAAVEHGHERTVYDELRWAYLNGLSLTNMNILGAFSHRDELKYGFNKVIGEWRYFVSHKMYRIALESVLLNGVRWIGVQLGKRAENLPGWMRGKIV